MEQSQHWTTLTIGVLHNLIAALFICLNLLTSLLLRECAHNLVGHNATSCRAIINLNSSMVAHRIQGAMEVGIHGYTHSQDSRW